MGKRKTKPKVSPTAVAREASCSRQLVSRLLARGFSKQQIIDRVREQRERKAVLEQGLLAAGKANGHASAIPSYAESQAVKEYHLAELRGIEVQIRRRQLYPLEPLRSICLTALNHLRARFGALPDELAQEFGREHAEILRTRIVAIFDEAGRVAQRECEKYGAPWPKDDAA
jgi:hypothetical protein